MDSSSIEEDEDITTAGSIAFQEGRKISATEEVEEMAAVPPTQLRRIQARVLRPSSAGGDAGGVGCPGAYQDGRRRQAKFHSWMIPQQQQEQNREDDTLPPLAGLSTPPSPEEEEGEGEENHQDDDDLVVANPVSEDLEAQFLGTTLPKAEEYHDISTTRVRRGPESMKQRQERRKAGTTVCSLSSSSQLTLSAIIIGAAALLFIVILLAVSLTVQDDDPSSLSDTIVMSGNSTSISSTSTSTTTTTIESHVLDLLPEDTILGLRNAGSYQNQALEWMLSDPSLANYSDTRILQRFALASFYFALDGRHWNNNTRWLSYEHHECSWSCPDLLQAVESGYIGDDYFAQKSPVIAGLKAEMSSKDDYGPCSSSGGDDGNELVYTHLWALSNNLKGHIPPELYLLTNLKTIVFLANPFQNQATISTRIGRLTSLESLAIMYSDVGGTIPTEIGLLATNLNSLYLFGNKLTGNVPSELGLLSNSLVEMHLSGNSLTGTIPSQLGSLHEVHRILLNNNELSGPIPHQLVGQMKELQRLNLSQNRLTGTIPTELGSTTMGKLERLLLYDNQLSGSLPSQMGTLDALKVVVLQDNQIGGKIPSELGLLTSNLGRLSVSRNSLSGTIPSQLNALAATNGSMFALDLSDNAKLLGTVPGGLCNIGRNSTTCPKFPFLPPYVCSFQFDCSNNNLCGCGCPCL